MMKRLYSSFPNGNAAIGLLLLRVLVAGVLVEHIHGFFGSFVKAPDSRSMTLDEIFAGCALVSSILVVVGLWTSIAASVALVLSLGAPSFVIDPLHSLFFAWLSLALALIGPGAWSLDARLFGWRQIRFPSGKAHTAAR